MDKFAFGVTHSGRHVIQAAIPLFMAILIVAQARPQSQGWEVEAQKKEDFLRRKNGPGTNSYFLNLDILTQVVPNPYGGTTRKEVR